MKEIEGEGQSSERHKKQLNKWKIIFKFMNRSDVMKLSYFEIFKSLCTAQWWKFVKTKNAKRQQNVIILTIFRLSS